MKKSLIIRGTHWSKVTQEPQNKTCVCVNLYFLEKVLAIQKFYLVILSHFQIHCLVIAFKISRKIEYTSSF
jgi:hypothetical protein